ANGVEPQTRRLLQVCRARNTPILNFVNKMDREVQEPLNLMDEIERELGMTVVPFTWPVGMAKFFGGVLDLRKDQMRVFRPGEDRVAGDEEVIDGLANPALADRESVRVSPSGASAVLVETVIEQRRGLPTLVVRNSRPWWPSKKLDVVVTVQGPQFKALSVAGSGLLEAKLSNQPSLQLSVAGSGDLNVQGIVAQQVDVGVAGSGDVRVKGAAQNLSVSVAGSGDAWLRELEAEDVKVSVAGSGDARVNARQRLRVNVAGSGDVRYTGPASNVTTIVTGSGTVRRD
ncbi:MAG: GIN domain-containing protein, partial [Betaproteobacteria bacterium]